MNTAKLFYLSLLPVVLVAASVIAISARASGDKVVCTIRDVKEQVVLYTIHRGSFDDIAPVIGNLFTMAAGKGIYPSGPISFVYLNDFRSTSSQHWLTEIRIPVGEDALKLAGTLGKMTDVKTVKAMKAAVAVKPEGMDNPSTIYRALYTWVLKKGHIAVVGPRETFLTNTETADYSRMKTEIMVPIWEFSPDKD